MTTEETRSRPPSLARLQEEHRHLLHALALFETLLRRGSDALPGIRTVVSDIAHQLALHARREEVELYPVLNEQLHDPRRNAIRALLGDHAEHEATLHLLQRLLLRGERANVEHIAIYAEHLIESLREHIADEERLLFPVAEELWRRTADRDALKSPRAQAPRVTADMTICAIRCLYPGAHAVFRAYGFTQAEDGDFLDEVAWRHGVDLHEVLHTLNQLVGSGCPLDLTAEAIQ